MEALGVYFLGAAIFFSLTFFSVIFGIVMTFTMDAFSDSKKSMSDKLLGVLSLFAVVVCAWALYVVVAYVA